MHTTGTTGAHYSTWGQVTAHLGSSYHSHHCWGRQSKSQNTHLVKLASTVSKTWSKCTRDALYLFLMHTGRGMTHLLCFWNTLPVFNFAIFVMVACRVFCRDNRIGRIYYCCLLAPHVEVYYVAMVAHDSLCKMLEFRADREFSPYKEDVHPWIIKWTPVHNRHIRCDMLLMGLNRVDWQKCAQTVVVETFIYQ
jgi:hypothetical protein